MLDELEAGPELDAEISRVVFHLVECDGWSRVSLGSAGGPVMMNTSCPHQNGQCYPKAEGWPGSGPRRYSTDIAAAWTIVEHMTACCFIVNRENAAGIRYDVTIYLDYDHKQRFDSGTVEEAPLAICLAALAALRSDD